MSLYNESSKINKPSIESNYKNLQNNENSLIQSINNKGEKVIVRIIPDIGTPHKIKNFYSNIDPSYIRRPSQKPNYMFEKQNTIKIDTPQLSDIYITNVIPKDNNIYPRVFEDPNEKNILNMPPVIEKDYEKKIIRTFEKIGNNNNLNFIVNKNTSRQIDLPIVKVASSKTVLKRL
jgi:hypothetical protein